MSESTGQKRQATQTPKPVLRAQPGVGSTEWATLSVGEAMAALGTGSSGLDYEEAAERLGRDGQNTLPRVSGRRWYLEFIANFIHLFALLLWTGAGLAWLAGMPQLAWAIVAVIIINGCFSYWQEYQAERAVEALEALLPRRVTVRRCGRELLVEAAEVVRGDVLVLSEGQAIPADARVVLSERLRVDTSSLTGESRPAPRYSASAPIVNGPLAVLPNLVFAGTSVASGRGEAVVFATGAGTEFGRIAKLTQAQRERQSPLELELRRVTRFVTMLALAFGLIFFIIGTSAGGLTRTEAFLFAIGIIVANVPEGLLPTLTLALALGVRRMARRNALVKRLSAVESLGAATIILTDKTGTLTENEMTVRELWTPDGDYALSGAGYDLDGRLEKRHSDGDESDAIELIRVAALCCDAHLTDESDAQEESQKAAHHKIRAIGDPTEAAIIVAAGKAGLSDNALKAWPRLSELPFDSTRKRMTTIQRIEGLPVACVKGAPSEIFPRCTAVLRHSQVVGFESHYRQEAEAAHDEMADRGRRVLAVARRSVDEPIGTDGWRVEDVERDLTLLGLIAMEDPPRKEVPAAIAACRTASVRVVMVTGDNGLTAAAIGREIGLHQRAPRIVDGVELDRLEDEQLDSLIEKHDLLFARVSPEHKLRLVEAYQRRREVVAVTGDGVNDAPALKRADIGIAMGETGTDVAREAADIVLTDDNFASIIAAIEEGRGVYDNVRKFVTYIFASNIPELVPFIAFVLFRIPLPLTVMQILAVDLGTDMVPALALGTEAPEPDVMRRSPRSRDERLLNHVTLLRAYGWLGLLEATFSLAGFFFAYLLSGWRPGETMTSSGTLYAAATTMTLAGIVACQVGNGFACRSSTQSVFKLRLTGNHFLLVGVAVELALLLLLIYVPTLARVFGLSPLGLEHWAMLAAFAPLVLLAEEARKALARAKIS